MPHNSVDKLARAIVDPTKPVKAQEQRRATVVRMDDDGTVWVHIPGGADETPCSATSVAVSPGDSVIVTLGGKRAVVTGNYSKPATDDTAARAAQGTADQAIATIGDTRSLDGTLAESIAENAKAISANGQAVKDATEALDEKIGTAQKAANDAAKAAATAQTTADGKNATFTANVAPTEGYGGNALAAGDVWYQTDDDSNVVGVLVYDGTAWRENVYMASKVLVPSSVGTTEIADNAVTTGKVAAGAIDTEQLNAQAVTAEKLAALAVTTDKLDANAVTAQKMDLDSLRANLAWFGDEEGAHVKLTEDGMQQSASDGATVIDTANEYVNKGGGNTADWFDATSNFSADVTSTTVNGIEHFVYTIPNALPTGAIITVYNLENGTASSGVVGVAALGTFTAGTAGSITSTVGTQYDYDGANSITYYFTENNGSEYSDICKFEWSYEEHVRCASFPEGAMLEGTWYMDLIHPVGSIYLSMDDTDPKTLFPGTYWTRIAKGRMLVGSSASPKASDYSDNSTDSWGELNHSSQKPPATGATGGSLKLTTRELPAHTHSFDRDGDSSSALAGDNPNDFGSVWRTVGSSAHTSVTTTSAGSSGNYLPAFMAVAVWQRIS